MLLCLLVVTPVVAETVEGFQLADTNLIVLCANKSDVTAHVKVSSVMFVRKPMDPSVVDLTVYGRLITLQVKRVYLQKYAVNDFPDNIYIFRDGAVELNSLEPIIEVGQEYLVFLKRENAPGIVNSGTVTDPVLPSTNYFAFIQLPERQMPNRKAYLDIANTNSLASIERCLSKSIVPGSVP